MSRNNPSVVLTEEMILTAKKLVAGVKVNRTVASEIDTVTGILGEFAFAQYFFGDWKKNRVGSNKGEVDFADVEVKTSAFPFNDKLNLLVREDYAKKRKPAFYVQVIIDVKSSTADDIQQGTLAYVCGFAKADEVDRASKRDFGSKLGTSGGYQCHYISISSLHPMNTFQEAYQRIRSSPQAPSSKTPP